MQERICLYPGSFDPVTLGHLDIIRRASALYDRVIVAVGHNPAKAGCFPVAQRLEMIRRVTAEFGNVSVASYEGLTVRFAVKCGVQVMIRGIRSASDFDAEWALAQVNRSIAPQVETILMAAPAELRHISSSAVREMAAFGADVTGYVPEILVPIVCEHFNS